jgi:hypothetical protein
VHGGYGTVVKGENTVKQIIVVGAALAAGFFGGVTSTFVLRGYLQPRPEQVVRARSFELVDRSGRVISYWGIDKGQSVVLAFGSRPDTRLAEGAARPIHAPLGLYNPANQLAAIGLLANDSPTLTLRGADGKTRVRLDLSDWAQPALIMEDETGPRVLLGIDQSDTPGPGDNNWALVFGPEERARIGMGTEKVSGTTYLRGGVFVNGKRVKYPYEQPK